MTFYGKLLNKATDRPMRWDSGTPHNFQLVLFSSRKIRTQAQDWVWDNSQKNLIACQRSDLLAEDFPVRLFDSLEEFVNFYYPDYPFESEEE